MVPVLPTTMLRIVVVLLLVAPAAYAAVAIPQDDAGSGRDAPGVPVPEVWIAPRVNYSAFATGVPSDVEDYYAFHAEAGDEIVFSMTQNVLYFAVVDASNNEVPGWTFEVSVPEQQGHAFAPQTGTFFLFVEALPPTPYSFHFNLGGEYDSAVIGIPGSPENGISVEHVPEAAPDVTGACSGADESTPAPTFGRGDASVPDLAWAATKTGNRAVIAFSTSENESAEVVFTVDGGAPMRLRAPFEDVAHFLVIKELPVGSEVCFQARHETGASAWHRLTMRNAMNAFDAATGTYSINLFIDIGEGIFSPDLIRDAIDVFAQRLFDATDGHVRAGLVIAQRLSEGAREEDLSELCDRCTADVDVIVTYTDPNPHASGHTGFDDIQNERGGIWMVALNEDARLRDSNEFAMVLLHELGHYAFGAQDLYTTLGSECYDPALSLSIMSRMREAREFDDEVARCPNEADLAGYVPTWTLLRERFPMVPDRAGPAAGPAGDGGANAFADFGQRVELPVPRAPEMP